MDRYDDHRDQQDRGAVRRTQRLQALSTAEIARRAAIRSGSRLSQGVPSQRDPRATGRLLSFVPPQPGPSSRS